MKNYEDFQRVVHLFSVYIDGVNGDLDIDKSQLETLTKTIEVVLNDNPELRGMLQTILHPLFCDITL